MSGTAAPLVMHRCPKCKAKLGRFPKSAVIIRCGECKSRVNDRRV
jgi:hypothetical protein